MAGYNRRRYRRKKGGIRSLFFPVLLLVLLVYYFDTAHFEILGREKQLYAAAAALAGLIILIEVLRRYIPKLYRKTKYRKAQMYEIDRMSGTEFERFLTVYFRDLGYKILPHHGGAGDKGADLILRSPEGLKYVVQAKRYSGKVPFEAVQQVYTARSLYEADRSIVISNYYLTKQAREAAAKLGIEVWERDRLIQNLYAYHKKPKGA